MLEKILLKLKEQRGQASNVSDRTLQDIAKNLEAFITTDELLEEMDVAVLLASIDGNISFHTAEAVKKLDAKKVDSSKKDENKDIDSSKKDVNDPAKKSEEVPVWAQTLVESNKVLADKLDAFEADKTTTNREVKLKKQIVDLPEFFTKPVLAGFKRTKFESEDEFEEYLTETKSAGEEFIQQAKENGLNTFAPKKEVKKPEDDGQTGVLSDARGVVQKAKEAQQKIVENQS